MPIWFPGGHFLSSRFRDNGHLLNIWVCLFSLLREYWLGGLTCRGEQEKSQKVTWGSHKNGVSPLAQGLRYRAACEVMRWEHYAIRALAYCDLTLTIALVGHSMVPGVTMTYVWSLDVCTVGVASTRRARQTFVDIFVTVRTCVARSATAWCTTSGFVAHFSITATYVLAVPTPGLGRTYCTEQRTDFLYMCVFVTVCNIIAFCHWW